MLEKILFPTDFSEYSVKAKNELLKLKKCNVKEIILLNVLDVRIFTYSTMMEVIEIQNFEQESEIVKGIQKSLDEWKAELTREGFNVKTVVREGIPFNEILNYAEEEKVTSIILGHKGVGPVERMLLGSPAEKVMRKANVPVILIR